MGLWGLGFRGFGFRAFLGFIRSIRLKGFASIYEISLGFSDRQAIKLGHPAYSLASNGFHVCSCAILHLTPLALAICTGCLRAIREELLFWGPVGRSTLLVLSIEKFLKFRGLGVRV